MGERFVVVANPGAGSHDRDALERAGVVLGAAGPVETVDGDAGLATALAATGGPAVVVAAGGDGTLHRVVQRLHDLGLLGAHPVGILPMGTANDVARAHGVPVDPAAAARVVVAGHQHPRDLIVADDGTVAVNAAHAGLGAEAARRASGLKARLGRLAYPSAAAAAALRPRRHRVVVRTGAGTELGGDDVVYVGVANTGRLGGSDRVHPDARPDDGRLGVLVLHDSGLRTRLATAWHLLRDRLRTAGTADWVDATAVEVTGDALAWDVDGEPTDPRRRVEWRVVPAAWHLRVPGAGTPG